MLPWATFFAAGVRLTPTSEQNAVPEDNSGQEATLGMAGPKQAVTTGPAALFQPKPESGVQRVDPMANTSPSTTQAQTVFFERPPSINGCGVAVGVQCRPILALFQELQRQLLVLFIALLLQRAFSGWSSTILTMILTS
jgi:hypothetical protein